jgi:3-hydroxyisobutyrate dehydrogenase
MAGHLQAKGGHTLTVFNRTPEKASGWVNQYGGAAASSPRLAASDADFVFACVGNDDDLREITIGPEGAFQGMKSGAIFIDHTTAWADVARELCARASQAGIGFLDAPRVKGTSWRSLDGPLEEKPS